MQITKEQDIAAGEIVDLIADKIGTNRLIHPGTAISTGARLAGSFMFRSFNFNLKDIKPGTVCLSEQANEKGPMLIGVLGTTLSNFGLQLNKEAMSTTAKADSNLSFAESMNIVQEAAHEIMKRNKLNLEQMAYACAMATAFVIKESKTDLSIESGFHTAVYSFIEGSKTCPPVLGGEAPVKKGFFGFWK